MTISALRRHSTLFFQRTNRILYVLAALVVCVVCAESQSAPVEVRVPPRIAQARRFLAQRHGSHGASISPYLQRPALTASSTAVSPPAAWQPLGPTAVTTQQYGLVTGRVSSIAIDPSDSTGNRVLIGTTGGGVWASQNAGASGSVVFTPLTENPSVRLDLEHLGRAHPRSWRGSRLLPRRWSRRDRRSLPPVWGH